MKRCMTTEVRKMTSTGACQNMLKWRQRMRYEPTRNRMVNSRNSNRKKSSTAFRPKLFILKKKFV